MNLGFAFSCFLHSGQERGHRTTSPRSEECGIQPASSLQPSFQLPTPGCPWPPNTCVLSHGEGRVHTLECFLTGKPLLAWGCSSGGTALALTTWAPSSVMENQQEGKLPSLDLCTDGRHVWAQMTPSLERVVIGRG